MNTFLITLAALPVAMWLGLSWFRSRFWRADQRLDPETSGPRTWPGVVAVVPARNEAEVIGRSLASLFKQDYPGELRLVVVDDGSEDGTAALAEAAAADAGARERLLVVAGEPAPPGWSGKVWALEQGCRRAESLAPEAAFVLFTDADIEHHPAGLRHLVAQAHAHRLDLVSLMVLLHCRSAWEQLLIPAFVFFFQMLYPFRRVNDRRKRTAAAAGGCMLVRREALARAGGLAAIRGALIDDCALARALKARGPVWLGLTDSTRSLRPYRGLGDIWQMVARSAYDQLGYSRLVVAIVVVAMILAFLVPPLAALGGALTGEARVALLGIAAWLLMMRCYRPTLKLYRRPWLSGLDLPVAAFVFILMTLDSARRWGGGDGVSWKGRFHADAGGKAKSETRNGVEIDRHPG
jgi:hopene-associated glycosyltransferase HpnB